MELSPEKKKRRKERTKDGSSKKKRKERRKRSQHIHGDSSDDDQPKQSSHPASSSLDPRAARSTSPSRQSSPGSIAKRYLKLIKYATSKGHASKLEKLLQRHAGHDTLLLLGLRNAEGQTALHQVSEVEKTCYKH